MRQQIFGYENAREDTILYKCKVNLLSKIEAQPILRGRWGVGKTATFLIRHRTLSRALRDVEPELEYVWYLDDGGLDAESLFMISEAYNGNTEALRNALQRLWRAEIIRTHARILAALRHRYGSQSGNHWAYITANQKNERYGLSVWKVLANAIDDAPLVGASLAAVVRGVGKEFSRELQTNVDKCLADIVGHELYPVTVIEPIEASYSEVSEQGFQLSQAVLGSLLDLYIGTISFNPKARRFLRVEISVPWNRSVRDMLQEPHKLSQYSGDFLWGPDNLKSFIDKRIEYEFEQTKRVVKNRHDRDNWTQLFDPKMRNNWCQCYEDSFSYALRHTHHRTRDLMRIARMALYAEVDIRRKQVGTVTVDDVLTGQGGHSVTMNALRKGVEEAVSESARDRVDEAKRRFPNILELIESLRGSEVPLKIGSFKTIVEKTGATYESAIDLLWESGIIGFEVEPLSESQREWVEKNVTSRAISNFKDKSRIKSYKRYFLFEYNCDFSPAQIERTYEGDDQILSIIIHPVFIEYLGVKPPRDYPVGV